MSDHMKEGYEVNAVGYEDVTGKLVTVEHFGDGDGDVGAAIVGNTVFTEVSAADNARVLRRIDVHLMPIMFVSYGLQFVDKAILSSAAQFGVITDLHLATTAVVDGVKKTNSTRFSYCLLIFYWGFLAGCIPCAYLAQRFPIGRFCGAAITLWGILTILTASITTYQGLLVQRFFLGFVEGAVPAAFSLIVAMWYKKHEQPLRIALWWAASGLGGIIGSLTIWGIGHIHGSLPSWKYQFLVLGAVTILWGIVAMVTLPNSPVTATWLSAEDKVIAVERMRSGQTGIENQHFKWYQVKEAFLDFKTWTSIVVIMCIQLTNGANSGFVTIIVASLGFTPLQSVLFLGALGAVTLVALPTAGFICLYVKNMRHYLAIFGILPMLSGALMLWKSDWHNISVPLAGFIMLGFVTLPNIMILALMTANTSGFTKKTITTALLWGAYCITNGYSPLLVKTTEIKEHYPTLCKPLISVLCLAIVTVVVQRLYLMRENARRDREYPVDESTRVVTAFADLTDKENPNFRYVY